MDFNEIRSEIVATIYDNQSHGITGASLQRVLLDMISAAGDNDGFMGFASTDTIPYEGDTKRWYLADTPGTYRPEFGNGTAPVLNEGEVAIFYYMDGIWRAETLNARNTSEIDTLKTKVAVLEQNTPSVRNLNTLVDGEDNVLYVGVDNGVLALYWWNGSTYLKVGDNVSIPVNGVVITTDFGQIVTTGTYRYVAVAVPANTTESYDITFNAIVIEGALAREETDSEVVFKGMSGEELTTIVRLDKTDGTMHVDATFDGPFIIAITATIDTATSSYSTTLQVDFDINRTYSDVFNS